MKKGYLSVLSICALLVIAAGCKEKKRHEAKPKKTAAPAKELAGARGFAYADKM